MTLTSVMIALVLAWVVSAEANAQRTASTNAPQPATAAPLVFDGVTVVDVEHGKLLSRQRVVVAGNRIQAVGAVGAVKTPQGAKVVDARGKYLIPGLWEMHLHFRFEPEDAIPLSYRLLIANGVTGFRDAASTWPLDSVVQWRREILAGTRVGPPRQLFSGFLDGVADPADAQRLVDSVKAAGADMVKTYNLSEPVYFAIAAAARRRGMRFGGHTPNVSPFAAADSGASIIDHVGPSNVGILDSLCFRPGKASVAACRAVAERFRRTNTWSVPTLGAYGVAQDAAPRVIFNLFMKTVDAFWNGAEYKYDPTWLRGYTPMPPPTFDSNYIYDLKIPAQVGLPILSGGDAAPEQVGFKTHTEMALLVDRGLTPLAALQAATLNPAKMLQATDSLGTVAAGKLADLVLLDVNPLEDITNTTTIRAVVANGRYYDRAALDSLLAAVRAKIKQDP